MLTGPTVWVAPPSSHRSRSNCGREPPCPPPFPLAAAIAPISGTPRCARERRTCMCPWSRRSCCRRRVHRRPFPPAFVSLTTGPARQRARAGSRAQATHVSRPRAGVGRAVGWATLAGRPAQCSFFCFGKIQFLYYFTYLSDVCDFLI
jgi:hypothetical protein